MKFLILSLFASLALASPISIRTVPRSINVRIESPVARNELDNGMAGACPKLILIYARGTGELGNLGLLTGVPLAAVLEQDYGDGNVWVQGVGGPYTAGLVENLEPGGTSSAAINEGVRLFTEAHQKCPSTPVVAGGYSQGSALIAGAISRLSEAARAQIRGVVLFGYTQDKQNQGQIPGYPASKLRIFCAPGDLVCDGTLLITPSHLLYEPYASGPGAQFLEDMTGST